MRISFPPISYACSYPWVICIVPGWPGPDIVGCEGPGWEYDTWDGGPIWLEGDVRDATNVGLMRFLPLRATN